MTNYLYHGSITPNIEILEPRKRYTPGALGKEVPPAVYAGDDPFYCIGHALPWSSKDGFDLGFDAHGKCVFYVPLDRKFLLNQEVYLYTVPKEKFMLLPNVAPNGHNYWSLDSVKTIKVKKFKTVFEAAEKLNGIILYRRNDIHKSDHNSKEKF